MLDISLYEELTKDFDEFYKAKAAVGEIREWKGIKYQKQVSGKWKPLKGQNIKKEHYPKLEKLYGTNYSQYQNDPKGAIEFLLKKKEGQVIGAYEKEGFGKIDIVWGDDKGGLRHIRKRHFIEQDDFSSYEDMAKKITDVLKNGKAGKLSHKGNRISLYKDDYAVFLVRDIVYNEEDDFRDKIWILTSYNVNKDKEDKIRKAVSNETALEKDQITLCPCNSSVSSRKNHLEQGRTDIVISQCSFSGDKDTLKKSLEQQFDEFLIQKARISYPIGTIKQFKVEGKTKDYIKTAKGWRPKGKGGTLQSEKEVKQDMSKETLNIKISDFGEKTLDLYNEAKKDNSLLHNLVDQLINSDFPAKDIFAFIKKEFKLSSKSSDFYEDYLQLKAYWKPHSQEFSDVNEVADWLYKEVYKITKSKNKFGETLSPDQTKELIKKFQERYEFDSYSQAEKVLKGLSFNGTKEYSMAFDTNFGQYHFYIGKRDKSEEKKNSEDVEVKEIKVFAIDEFQNRVNAFVKYKGKSYAVSVVVPRLADEKGYTIYAKELKYLTSDVRKNSERDRAIIRALNRTTYDDFEGIKDDNETEEKPSNSIKQITQTYVKVDDGQIIIRMNKDKTRYKASKGDFKVESNEGEGIVEFKKRIKEEYKKRTKTEDNEESIHKSILEIK